MAISESLVQVQETFQNLQLELDSKHDKQERLVKLSRDCTIKSKRIIFTLHRVSGIGNHEDILIQAKEKILSEILVLLEAIALEISGDDYKKFHTAFSPGLQEFIEALSFLIFLKERRLVMMTEIQSFLSFKYKCGQKRLRSEPGVSLSLIVNDLPLSHYSELLLPCDAIDYALGIADMTGELMRLCINAVGSGDKDVPFNILPFIKAIYMGFLSLKPFSKEFSRKLVVMKNSVLKVENVCYALKIRNSEVPKHILLHAISPISDRAGNPKDMQSKNHVVSSFYDN